MEVTYDNKYLEAYMLSLKDKGAPVVDINQLEFRCLEEIGKGAEGVVYNGELVIGGEKNKIAIKKAFVKNDSDFFKYLDIEVNCLITLNNECFPQLLYIYLEITDKFERNICMVFKYIEGWNLSDFRSKELRSFEKAEYLIQLCDIIRQLHSKKIIHRDIKPNNIMVTNENKVVLLDFGVSKICRHTHTFTSKDQGTTRYMPPENYDFDLECTDENYISVSPKFDIWSLGCVIFELITNEYPWYNCNEKTVEFKLGSGNVVFPIPTYVEENEKVYTLITQCVKTNPEERPNIDVVKEKLLEILEEINSKK